MKKKIETPAPAPAAAPETMLLPVSLDAGELAARSAYLADAVEERSALDAARRVEAGKWRSKIADVLIQIERLARVVASGHEDRPVPIEHRIDGADRVTWRLDKLEEIERRPATPAELQVPLFAAPLVVEVLHAVAAPAASKRRRKAGRPAESSLPLTPEHRAALDESEARDREYHARIAAEDRDAAAMLAGRVAELDDDEGDVRRCADPACDLVVDYPDNYCDEHDDRAREDRKLAERLGVSPPVSKEVQRFEGELARLNAKRDYEAKRDAVRGIAETAGATAGEFRTLEEAIGVKPESTGQRLERLERERREKERRAGLEDKERAEREAFDRAVGRKPPEAEIP